jgi:uncharacterized protein (DUF433 family)
MNYKDRIVADPKIMLGKPTIKGTRITVELLLKKLSDGFNIEEILSHYPHLTKEDVLAAVEYASEVIANEELLDA